MAVRFIALNRADAATLSCSPAENAVFPMANLKTANRGDQLRTAGTTASLRASFAASQSISAVALCQHNLTAAATWRIQVWTGAAFTGGPAYDSGVVTAYDSTEIGTLDAITDTSFIGYKNSVIWFTPATGQSLTIDLVDSGNADGYLTAARLFAGPYDTLAWNFDWGHPLSLVDPATQSRTLGGSLLSQNNGPSVRTLELPFDKVGLADRHYLFDLMRVKGLSTDLFLSAWPGVGGKKERDYQMACKIVSMQGIDQPLLNYYGAHITFGEY